MQPGIDLRLRTMMKALADVVMPSIDPGNRMAQEQAAVILGSMQMLIEQIDYAHWYEVVDLKSLVHLAADLERVPGLSLPVEVGAAHETASALAGRWDVTLTELRRASAELREAICGAVEVAATQGRQEIQNAVQRLVLDQSREQLGRERAYVAGTKWDGFPESLQTIEASLQGSRNGVT